MLKKNEILFFEIEDSGELNNAAHEVSVLAREIWTEHYTPIVGRAQVDYMLANFQSAEKIAADIKGGYKYYTAREAGTNRTVGYLAFCRREDYTFLSKIYVLKEYRGQGIARRFFDITAEHCKKEGLEKIRLRVNMYNYTTIAVYKKTGFAVIAEEKNDIGGGFVNDDYYMELKLPTTTDSKEH